MGIAFSTDDPPGVSVSAWAGNVTLSQAGDHVAALAADPAWGAHGIILTDLSGMTAAGLPTAEQVSELSRMFESELAGRARTAKWAVVANLAFSEASRFGREIDVEARRLIVFFDLASACIWLGIDIDATKRVVRALRERALENEHGNA